MGRDPLDLVNYGETEIILSADELLRHNADIAKLAELVPMNFTSIPSMDISYSHWKRLTHLCDDAVAQNSDLTGIVILHGTSTLEETAYFLHLALKVDVPVVIVGSQRPVNALSSDAGLNLANGIRTAVARETRGLGVVVLLNDEIHSAREVTKSSTYRLQTFHSPDFGLLGHADPDAVAFYRRPVRRHAPYTEFDIRGVAALPRVDIAYAYTGSDGAAVRAFVNAGAEGLVSAGFAPGFNTPEDEAALLEATERGVVVVQSTRGGSGRVVDSIRLRRNGFVVADNLTPQKARILLALALTVTCNREEIERIFREY